MKVYICEYCGRECGGKRSYVAHTCACPKNRRNNDRKEITFNEMADVLKELNIRPHATESEIILVLVQNVVELKKEVNELKSRKVINNTLIIKKDAESLQLLKKMLKVSEK